MPYSNPRFAETYDRDRLWEYENPESRVEHIVELLQLDSDEVLLEVGCGTGFYLQHFVSRTACTAIGVDQSEGMLGIAQERLVRYDHTIKLLLGTAESLPIDDFSVDAILCHHAVHHFRDFERFVIEARRVVAPHGRIAIVSVSHAQMRSHPIYQLFPHILDIDLNRIPDTVAQETLVRRHFSDVSVHTVDGSHISIESSAIQKHVRARFMSCMHELSDDAFNKAYDVFCSRVKDRKIDVFPAESCTVVLATGFIRPEKQKRENRAMAGHRKKAP